jgi:hypothetical protein
MTHEVPRERSLPTAYICQNDTLKLRLLADSVAEFMGSPHSRDLIIVMAQVPRGRFDSLIR